MTPEQIAPQLDHWATNFNALLDDISQREAALRMQLHGLAIERDVAQRTWCTMVDQLRTNYRHMECTAPCVRAEGANATSTVGHQIAAIEDGHVVQR